jgi:peptide/nickel transport system permease protein
MFTYIFKRIGLIIPTFIGITLITFLIIQLAPGDPAAMKLQGAGPGGLKSEAMAKTVIAQTRELYGLNEPLYKQYGLWLKRLVTLDFGESFKDHRPVIDKIKETLPITLTLNIISIFIIYLISVPLGIFSALHPRSVIDKITTFALFVLYSLPSFWVASLLIVFLGGADYLNLFPIVGFVSDGASALPWYGWLGNVAWHLVLPVMCLTYGGFAFLSRLSRASVLEVIRQDYIRTARAKGLPRWKVVYKHVLRNAMIPFLTLMGTLLPALLGGSVIIEQIFSIPGMGRLSFESVLMRDYPTIMAIAAIDGVLTLVGILISDILYVVVDPRITFNKLD